MKVITTSPSASSLVHPYPKTNRVVGSITPDSDETLVTNSLALTNDNVGSDNVNSSGNVTGPSYEVESFHYDHTLEKSFNTIEENIQDFLNEYGTYTFDNVHNDASIQSPVQAQSQIQVQPVDIQAYVQVHPQVVEEVLQVPTTAVAAESWSYETSSVFPSPVKATSSSTAAANEQDSDANNGMTGVEIPSFDKWSGDRIPPVESEYRMISPASLPPPPFFVPPTTINPNLVMALQNEQGQFVAFPLDANAPQRFYLPAVLPPTPSVTSPGHANGARRPDASMNQSTGSQPEFDTALPVVSTASTHGAGMSSDPPAVVYANAPPVSIVVPPASAPQNESSDEEGSGSPTSPEKRKSGNKYPEHIYSHPIVTDGDRIMFPGLNDEDIRRHYDGMPPETPKQRRRRINRDSAKRSREARMVELAQAQAQAEAARLEAQLVREKHEALDRQFKVIRAMLVQNQNWSEGLATLLAGSGIQIPPPPPLVVLTAAQLPPIV